MQAVEKLSDEELAELKAKLDREIQRRTLNVAPMQDAVDQPNRDEALARWRKSSGNARSDFTDVSTHKSRHLAEVTAPKP